MLCFDFLFPLWKQQFQVNQCKNTEYISKVIDQITLSHQFSYISTNYRCQAAETVERCWFKCPKNWELYRESCYFFNPETSVNKFSDAVSTCNDLGGYLVEIESKPEDDYIINKVTGLAKSVNVDYWIGAEDLDNDGNWIWHNSGNPVVSTVML